MLSLVIIASLATGLFLTIPNLLSQRPASPSPLAASFTFSPSSPNAGQTVTFIGSASGGSAPYRYSWGLGDGSNGTGQLVTHVYKSSGAFIVTLSVNDHESVQRSAATRQIVAVGLPLSLITSFTFSPSLPQQKQEVTFAGSATGGVPPYSYYWNFGDGWNGTGQSVTHAYSSAGNFTVVLTTKDSGAPEQSRSSQQTFTVTSSSYHEIKISYSYTYNNTCCGFPPQQGATLLVFHLSVTNLGYPNFTADPFKDMYVVISGQSYNISAFYYVFLSDRFNGTSILNMTSATGNVVFEVPLTSPQPAPSPGWTLPTGEQIVFDWVNLSI